MATENNPDNPLEFIEETIRAKKNKNRTRTDLWRQILKEFQDFLFEKIRTEHWTLSDIHYALSEYVKKKYGEKYLITRRYFYTLWKKTFNANLSKKKVRKADFPNLKNSHPEEEKKLLEEINPLEEFNKGGIL